VSDIPFETVPVIVMSKVPIAEISLVYTVKRPPFTPLAIYKNDTPVGN
jgi:hypothetical protein